MDIVAVTAQFSDLTVVELTHWVELGWVVPDTEDTVLVFREIDVARVRLIHDLRHDMDIGEDAIPLVLSLLDQIYDLRGRMNALLTAVVAQPPDVRTAVLEAIRQR
jgi:chaperone modulatory protein CbpM